MCVCVFFFFLMFIFERELARERKCGRGSERGRHRIRSRLQGLSCQAETPRCLRTPGLFITECPYSVAVRWGGPSGRPSLSHCKLPAGAWGATTATYPLDRQVGRTQVQGTETLALHSNYKRSFLSKEAPSPSPKILVSSIRASQHG